MKKILALAAVLFAASAARGTVLTGTLRDASGVAISGNLWLTLGANGNTVMSGGCPAIPPTYSGSYSITPGTSITFPLTLGQVPGGSAVVGTDCIAPATYYWMTAIDDSGRTALRKQVLIAGSSADIGNLPAPSGGGGGGGGGGIPRIDTGTGLSGGPIIAPNPGTLSITPTGVGAGSCVTCSLSFNAEGQITAASSGGGGSFTAGSVIFEGASGLSENNAAFFWDRTNLRLGIGTNAPITKFQVVDTSDAHPRGITLSQFSNSDSGGVFFGQKARGTPSSPLSLLNGDTLFGFVAQGYNGTNFVDCAAERFYVEGNPSGSVVPSAWAIYTDPFCTTPFDYSQPSVSVSPTNVFRIHGTTSGYAGLAVPAVTTPYTYTLPGAAPASAGLAVVTTDTLGHTAFMVLPPGGGGTGSGTPLTPGSVPFAGAGGALTEDNANLSYDATAHALSAARAVFSGNTGTTTGIDFRPHSGSAFYSGAIVFETASVIDLTPGAIDFYPLGADPNAIRLANDQNIVARNPTDSGDDLILYEGSDGNLWLGNWGWGLLGAGPSLGSGCLQVDASTGIIDSTGTPCGSGGGGAISSVTDGTTTVNPASTLTLDGSGFVVTDGGGGDAQVALAPTAVTPGSYTSANITVDQMGRITAAASSSAAAPAEMTALLHYNAGSATCATATLCPLPMDTEDRVVGLTHSTVTNSSRVTIPTGGHGLYSVVGQVSWGGENFVQDARQLFLRVNGSATPASDSRTSSNVAVGGAETQAIVSAVLYLNDGDYVEVVAAQYSALTLDISGGDGTRFTMTRLSEP